MYIATMNIATRLDQAMKEAKIKSQSELHRMSGVPQATISRILSNQGTKGPETETVRRLAASCGVSFEWLIEGVNSVPVIQMHELTPEECQIILVYRAADADGKDLFKSAVETNLKRGRSIGKSSAKVST